MFSVKSTGKLVKHAERGPVVIHHGEFDTRAEAEYLFNRLMTTGIRSGNTTLEVVELPGKAKVQRPLWRQELASDAGSKSLVKCLQLQGFSIK